MLGGRFVGMTCDTIYNHTGSSTSIHCEYKCVAGGAECVRYDKEFRAFNQLVEAMGLEQEEVNAILANKADLVVPTETYVTTVQDNEVLNQYISFDEKGHSMARKKYFAQIAEETAKRMNLQSEAEQAEVIHTVIVSNFPEEGAQQDMGAACILENPSNPYQAWKRMYADTKTAIDARLGSIVKNLKEGMSRGNHVYVSDGIGHEAKRMSDNDAWYGEFYKQHKRKPNERELLDMAREIYGGGGAKYGAAGIGYENLPDEAQADIDALDRDFETLNVLEDIKDTVSQLTASEMTVTKGLSPSGYRVYQLVRGQLAQGNKDVQDSARVNAILFARYADRMAENISKITGKEYTAEDYVRERIMLVPNATQVDESAFNMPITNLNLDLDRQVKVLDLDEMSDELKGKSTKEIIAHIKEISNGVKVPTADFKAIVGLPDNADTYGQRHIIFNGGSWRKRNVTARNKVLSNLFQVISATRVVEVSPNKKIKEGNLTDAQKRKNQVEYFYRLFVPVKMNKNLYTLLVTVEDFNRNVKIVPQKVSLYEISTSKIEGIRPSTALDASGTIPSMLSIREVLRNVKDVDGNPYINPDGSGNFAVLLNQFADGHLGRGYHGWSKSNNAVSAEDEGRFPATVAAKKLGVKAGAIKLYIPTGEWHHTSNHYNKTYYYDIADLLLYKEGGRDALAEEGYDETEIDRIENLYNDMKAYKEPKADEQVYRADITYVEWGGTRKHPKADEQKYENVIVRQKGSFYTFTLPNGTKVRKKIGSNGTKVKRIPDLEEAQASAETLDKVGERTRRFLEDNHKGYEVSWSGTVYPQGKKPTSKEYDDPKAFFTKGDMILRNENGKAVLQEWTGDKWETVEESTGVNPQSLMYAMSQVALYEARNGVSLRGETYNQSVRGQTRISGASRMVSLFEQADKSTFVHEMGHVALADLKLLAEMEGAPAQLVRDWNTIKEWLGVKPSQKELSREQHEQFAKGFEAYLRSGEAPVRGLKSVFRKFKKWLCDIYADFVQLGGKPSAEVAFTCIKIRDEIA